MGPCRFESDDEDNNNDNDDDNVSVVALTAIIYGEGNREVRVML